MTTPQPITIRLAFVEADPQQPDPATVDALGRAAFNALRGQGYAVEPAYTGAKGIGALYDVAIQATQVAYENRELLTTLVEKATEILLVLVALRKEREKSDEGVPAEITITIDNRSITLPPAEVESDQALLERLLQEHPDLPQAVTPTSQVTITTRVQG
jgi:hypothetical protein